jgi:F-type H+-transporting ATPase subunit gamma
MASLQELRQRQHSVKSTRKITQAMKMIAAAKLRKAQDRAESNRPYAVFMAKMIRDLVSRSSNMNSNTSNLLSGNGNNNNLMIIVVTSDKGLCGGFNGSVVRRAKMIAGNHQKNGGDFTFFCVGRKGYDQLRFEHKSRIVESHSIPDKPSYEKAEFLGDRLISLFKDNTFDCCVLVYNHFVSAMTQEIRANQLIPFKSIENLSGLSKSDLDNNKESHNLEYEPYEYEPGEEEIRNTLLPKNISVQLLSALLESSAGEQGARMTAMDSATRNAGDMILNLQLVYNRTRQAHITRELIEIISGAEAL